MVDDGSNEQAQSVLEKIDTEFALVTLVRRIENGGKGAAVQTGLVHAHQAG
ncbi:glycosyltransferase (plasmid) [Pseudoalteromonas espejiana]